MRTRVNLWPQAERGLILMDSSYTIISLDHGAAEILNSRYATKGDTGDVLDTTIRDSVRDALGSEVTSPTRLFRIGTVQFTCRAYILSSQEESLAAPLITVILERYHEVRDRVEDIAAEYHLTKREEQALRGLCQGISIKALAASMNIQPSTLRAFLRLIKIKMGVTTRAGIIGKLMGASVRQ